MIRCAIMQPTYMPWVGYFSLIKYVDFFIFLDDVQFSKQSWQCRNQFLIDKKIHWLTVPVVRPDGLRSNISEVLVDDRQNWRDVHIFKIQENYKKHPYFKELKFIFDILKKNNNDKLVDLNIEIISQILSYLNMSKKILKSSVLNVSGQRSEKLYLLCKEVGAEIYVSPQGAQNYLEEDNFEKEYPIQLEYFSYDPKKYPQKNCPDFIEKLSFYDLLANVGTNANQYI